MKAGWSMAMVYTMDTIQANMKNIDWPFIVLHGDADAIVMVDGSIQLEKLAKSKDKTIKVN
jgi:alpha-beta hydrolase superfamily lysophospholipase